MNEDPVRALDEAYDRSKECPIIHAMNILSSKWMMPIIWHLLVDGDMTYNELTRTVKGISNTMLTRCLHELMDKGIVIRYDSDDGEPRSLYSLSESGRGLLPAMQCLFDWGADHMERMDSQ